ncbi:MAG TPA: alkaline phosphatase family protein, partial [Caulobacteraceae bacterium]|nr:alkaline phosphatase family protein [Caulobacteraceae bacterium]
MSLLATTLTSVALAFTAAAAAAQGLDAQVPHYDHIVVIVDENKDVAPMMDPRVAPNFVRLAHQYGRATRFFGEVHPSEANYIALVGGDTFGIHDDDAYYCHQGLKDAQCVGTERPDYPDHTIHAPHLGDQIIAKGLSWAGYYQSLPDPGSLAANAGDPTWFTGVRGSALYASKHSGFINFADVQQDPDRAKHIVGFDRLYADITADTLPAFALVVPNQCDDMHGLHAVGAPATCDGFNMKGLIGRGDAMLGDLVARLQATKAWNGPGNFAIVITYDESGKLKHGGCCGVTPAAPSNFGGGQI